MTPAVSHRGGRGRRAALLLPLIILFLVGAQEGSRGLITVKSTGSISDIKGNAGKRYALCVGVNEFKDKAIPRLKGARNDAAELAETLKKLAQFDLVVKMTDDIDPAYDTGAAYPSLKNIRARMAALSAAIRPDDLVVFFFAGHGIATEAGDGYLLVADTRVADKWNTSLPVREIVDWVGKLGVKKSLLLLDACRVTMSGGSRGLADTSLRAQSFEQSKLSAIFYATKTGWSSYDDPNSDHGIFTRFLLEGVRGKADYQSGNADGIVSFTELSSFVEQQVTSYAHEQQLDQSPSISYNGESFGDLALSTYSASVDAATRIESTAEQASAGTGEGSMELYSNVEGKVVIDGADQGSVAKGQTRVFEDIPAGLHRIVITHPWGVFEKEFTVRHDARTRVANMLIVKPERDNRQVGDMPFVFVKGKDGLPDFWMGMTEVRFGQFANFVRQSGYKAQGTWERYYKPAYDYYPVIHVTWDDCMAYVKWFSKKFKVSVALPSLAQWQHAAGGRYATVYPWGNDWDPGYCQTAESTAPDVLPLQGDAGPVQELFFLNDMTLDGVKMLSGNVSEWCADHGKAADGTTDLAASSGGSWRVARPKYFTAGYSQMKPVTTEDEDQGFRVVMQAE
jgi:uncharacterized caspase-like protein